MKDKDFLLLIMLFLMVLVLHIPQVLVNAEHSSTNDTSWQTAMNTITNSSLFKNVVKGYNYSLIGFSPHWIHDRNWNWINQLNSSEMNFNLFNGTNFVETVQVILDSTLSKVVNVAEWHPNFDDYGKFGTKNKLSPAFRQEFSMNFKKDYASME